MDIKAIQTRYGGCHFRSRTEARFAVFFDTLGIKRRYERQGYDLGDLGWYLPDFYLPELKCFIEIKGVDSTPIEKAKCERLSKLSDVFIFDDGLGEGFHNENNWYSSGMTPSAFWYSKGKFKDYPAKFSKCDKCKTIDIVFDGWLHYSDKCSCYNEKNRNKMGSFHPDILKALESARSARFEHGESGAT